MTQILLHLLALMTALNATSLCDNDGCLMSTLGLDVTSIHSTQREIIMASYSMADHQFTDSALIWTQPSSYFTSHFMQSTVNSPAATDEEFRFALYRKYVSSNHLQLVLEISDFDGNRSDLEQLKLTLSLKYKFDAITLNNQSSRTRRLQGNYGQGDDMEFDILNQRSYDEYDWFLYAFTLCMFGCCCALCGWCAHKKYVANLIVDDKDIESLVTPMTPSGSRQYAFNGFNLFGEALKRSNSIRRRNSNSQRSNTVPSGLPELPPAALARVTATKMERVASSTASPHQIQVQGNPQLSQTHLSAHSARSASELDLNDNSNMARISNSTMHAHQMEMLSDAHQYALLNGTTPTSSAHTVAPSPVASTPVQAHHVATVSTTDENGNVIQLVAVHKNHSSATSVAGYQPAPPLTEPPKMTPKSSFNEDAPPSPLQPPVPAPGTFVKVIRNPDQQQRKKVPTIIMPPKNAAIVPRYKEQIMSPQTVGLATPDSEEKSQSHLSMEIVFGGQTPSERDKRVAVPMLGYTPDPIREDVEIDHVDNPYAQYPDGPTMSPSPPPTEDQQHEDEEEKAEQPPYQAVAEQLHVEVPQPPSSPPPEPPAEPPANIPDVIEEEEEVGLEAIDECTPTREVWSPETVKSTVKAIQSYEIPVAALQDDINKAQSAQQQ